MMKQLLLFTTALAACATTTDDESRGLEPSAGSEVDSPLLGGAPGQWVWHDIPGSVCGYGQQTGIGVSVGTSDEVMIYLEGGGLCWDELTCAASIPPLPPVTDQTIVLASYFTQGFTRETFEGNLAGGGYRAGIFDRTLPNNPYKDATQIYVPYCTGDVHTGNAKGYFPHVKQVAHWNGRQNLDGALAAVLASFPDTTRVTLAGSSAGAYGATLAYDHVAKAFDPVRVDLVADSGPLLAFSPFLAQGYPVWNTNAVIPDECPACIGNYPALYGYYAQAYPDARFAFLSHDEDLVIAAGHLQLPYPGFYFTIKGFTQGLAPLANWRSFVSAGTGHTTVYNLLEPSIQKRRICRLQLGNFCVFYDPFNEIEVSRTVLADWLTQMATDDPAWASKTSINQ